MSGIGMGGLGHKPGDEPYFDSVPNWFHSSVTVNVGLVINGL